MKKSGSTTVRPTGSHVSGSGTLTNPGTHAPELKGGNTSPPRGVKSNGVMPGAPSGGITFEARPESHIKLNARSVVGKAHSNQSAKAYSKAESTKETSGFSGLSTAGNRAKAVDNPYGLKKGYGK